MAKQKDQLKEVKPFGNAGHVTVEKKHIGKYAKVTILKEDEDE